ncbi:2-(1,2-epoxy-1,2-dihydrophenyl)acetyl-CoA isomerase [Croceicoccus estronivorus]|uniref:enoyl-CoA hydratase-related protein n=1 Tax=Croceicoccus estronivorus TaxID=1172626 RepID=UPI00082CB756|nr:enoyl-CoA hydratase-related protein [Croceicoccus estronivorus]OCC23508.1 2-(1,2-epoxy-1,2-dihydrophenyl)acetyl-CoA isomerase [Croceicoccus estronivorus]
MAGDCTTIVVTCASGVMEIVLDRPDLLNSINTAMRAELSRAFAQAETDRTIRCVLLTGNGRAFCAGQDLGERKPLPDGQKYDLSLALEGEYNPLLRQITNLPKPVVCAVNGVAAGAGVSLALAADITFAARSARFVLSFANIGLGPDCGASWLLPRLIGPQRAAGFAMSGDPVSATQAEAWGMIWRCIPDEELIPSARSFARQLAVKGPLALAATKRALAASWHNTFSAQLDLERDSQQALGYSDDYTEGVAAFRDKRMARFGGR